MDFNDLTFRIRKGDQTALKELVDACGPDVYRQAFAKTKDRELALLATKQTFRQFVTALREDDGADGWRLWFNAIVNKNIQAYSQVEADVSFVGRLLDDELFAGRACAPQQAQPASAPATPVQAAPEQAAFAPPYVAVPPVSVDREPEPTLYAPDAPEPIAQPARAQQAEPKRRAAARNAEPEKPARPRGRGLLAVLLVALSLALIWCVLGIAMALDWIPDYDLGYVWFNQNVFQLFGNV